MMRFTVLAGVVLLLAGCAGRPVVTAQAPSPRASCGEPLVAVANFPDEGYRLEPGDAIQIRYTHHPELTQDDVIRPDGKITAKIVGDITAAGMTTKKLEAVIEKAVAGRVTNPEVVVSVIRFSEKLVYVGGEVARPGTFPYRKGLTPLQAVMAAGGFRDTARVDSVILVRNGGSETNFIACKLNLDQMVTDDGTKEPVALAPHDVLFVPRTEIADVNAWLKQHIVDTIPLFRQRSLFPVYIGPPTVSRIPGSHLCELRVCCPELTFEVSCAAAVPAGEFR